MELHPTSRRKIVVERVADERVREANSTGLTRNLVDDSLTRRLVEYLEQLITAHIADALERVKIELAPQHGRQHEDEAAVLGKAAQSAADHGPDALRQDLAPRLGA